jgi:hypothetical protein
MLGDIRDNVEVVVATLIHDELFLRDEPQGSLVEVKDLLKELPVEVVDEVEFPVPDVVILVGKEEVMRFDLLLCLVCCLRISFL